MKSLDNKLALDRHLAKHISIHLFLIAIIVTVFLVLASRNLELGFVSDILDVQYHFERLGIREGIHHTLLADRKHFLLGIYYGVIYWLSPGESAGWYGSSILLHLINSLILFVLVDSVLRQRHRWLSFSFVLVFAFHVRQIEPLFDIATGGHQKIAFGLVLLSFLFHIRYLRSDRRSNLWHELSIICFFASYLFYETGVLLFLVIPILNYFEDRQAGNIRNKKVWILQTVKDILWYPLLFLAFWIVYNLLIVVEGTRIRLDLGYILEQFASGLWAEFSPAEFYERIAPTFSREWQNLTLLLIIIIGLLFTAWILRAVRKPTSNQRADLPSRYNLIYLVAIGSVIILAGVAGPAPGPWPLARSPRLLYPVAAGISIFLLALLVWLGASSTSLSVRVVIFAMIIAFLISTGLTTLLQTQDLYLNEEHARQRVMDAIIEAVPAFRGEILPYILLITDVDPDSLALHGQDIRYPYMFDRAYNMTGILADAVYYDVPETFPPSARPAPDLPMTRYIGPYIVVEENAIYSPLRPGLPIDLERLVVVSYDSQTNQAEVLDRVPEATLESGNIIMRAHVPLETNWDLVGSSDSVTAFRGRAVHG